MEDNSKKGKYLQLNHQDIAKVRNRLWKEQDYKCAICQLQIPAKQTALDHKHRKRRSDPIGLNGGGLVRGVLCRGCNIIEYVLVFVF